MLDNAREHCHRIAKGTFYFSERGGIFPGEKVG